MTDPADTKLVASVLESDRRRRDDEAFGPKEDEELEEGFTPEIAGFSTAEAVAYLRALRGIQLVGCDVVEVSPPYDGAGQQTALAGANVLWELLALRALRP